MAEFLNSPARADTVRYNAYILMKQVTTRLSIPREHRAQIDGARTVTPEQIERVRSSFAKVAASQGQAAAMFYRRLFELEPSLRPLFRGDMTAQGARLMASLRHVVGALDRLERVLPALRKLGRRHAAHGVRPTTTLYSRAGAWHDVHQGDPARVDRRLRWSRVADDRGCRGRRRSRPDGLSGRLTRPGRL